MNPRTTQRAAVLDRRKQTSCSRPDEPPASGACKCGLVVFLRDLMRDSAIRAGMLACLVVPLANWDIVGTGNFDSSGSFIFTTNISSQEAQRFYVIRVP